MPENNHTNKPKLMVGIIMIALGFIVLLEVGPINQYITIWGIILIAMGLFFGGTLLIIRS
jgi:hypothetical protein